MEQEGNVKISNCKANVLISECANVKTGVAATLQGKKPAYIYARDTSPFCKFLNQ